MVLSFDPDWQSSVYENPTPSLGLGLLVIDDSTYLLPAGDAGDEIVFWLLSEARPPSFPAPVIDAVVIVDVNAVSWPMSVTSYPEAPDGLSPLATLAFAHGTRPSAAIDQIYVAWSTLAGMTAWALANIPGGYESWTEDQSDQPDYPSDLTVTASSGAMYTGAMFGDLDDPSVSDGYNFSAGPEQTVTNLDATLCPWIVEGTAHSVALHSFFGIYGWALWRGGRATRWTLGRVGWR